MGPHVARWGPCTAQLWHSPVHCAAQRSAAQQRSSASCCLPPTPTGSCKVWKLLHNGVVRGECLLVAPLCCCCVALLHELLQALDAHRGRLSFWLLHCCWPRCGVAACR